MLEIVLFVLFGSLAAAIWDLKTTEVPDELSYVLVAVGILYWLVTSIMSSDFGPFYLSLFIGSLLLIAGLVLYRFKQWGEADAWILAAIGYSIPLFQGKVFMIDYLFNFFVVSIVYTVLYAVIVGLRNKQTFRTYAKDLRSQWKTIVLPPVGLFALLMVVLVRSQLLFLLPVAVTGTLILFGFLMFWRYALIIEKRVFKKRIPVKQVRVGDVVEGMKWVGITSKEIALLKKNKKFAIVKEGIRFIPVFPITLIITLLLGNLLLLV